MAFSRQLMPLQRILAAVLLAVTLLAASGDAYGQYFRFGKNKVQYHDLEWHFLQSDHFDVYYYEPGGEQLAQFAARAAEEAYGDIAELFDYGLTDRIAILVYQGHNEFAVTNAVDLPAYAEGIGGVTELYKNRVALPFTGDYREFRRVLHHEIVHALVNDMFYGGSLQRIIQSGTRLRLPLWFSEGIAEYSALGWDSHSDMYLREAIAYDRLPPVPGLYGYFAYRGGQGFFDFLAAEYGREKITEVIQRLKAGSSMDGAFRAAVGMDLDALSERWHTALKAAHFPEIAAREELRSIARPLVTAEQGGRYHTAAAISPRGDRVAYLSATGALFDLYVVETSGEARPQRLIAGQTDPSFESFRILSPGISWNPAGTRLALAVKAGRSDAIALVDVATRRTHHHRVPGIDAILSVRWSPDGRRIAFSATARGSSDIYILDLQTDEVQNLTDDAFSDLEPAWAPDGGSLVFHSDRGDQTQLGRQRGGAEMADHDFGQFSLYRLDLAEPGRLERLTDDPDWDETGASFGSEPDRLLFISDRNGVHNLFELRLSTGEVRPLTDLFTGITQASLSLDGRSAALVALHDGVPSVYLLRDPFARQVPTPLAPTVWAQRVMGDRLDGEAPSLLVAHPSVRRDNPFLREAADGMPYLADIVRRKRLPEDVQAALRARPEADTSLVSDSLIASRDLAAGDSAAYGGVRIDFRSYDFSEAFEDAGGDREPPTHSPRPGRFAPPDHLNEDGTFRPRRYRLRFSPDLIYGNLGYDAIFGVQSITQLSVSDLLGNHRLSAATNLVIDLRNSDYLLSYQYLPLQTDYSLTGFHMARQLTDFNRQSFYRYRNYGLVAAASYPLDKFRRIEGELSVQGVSLTDLMNPALRSRERIFFFPALTYTTDRTVPGFLAPAGGRRFAVRVSGTPGPSVAFASVLGDVRQYFGGHFYSLALRAAAGASVGPNQQRFYAAGVQNWINPSFTGFPIRDENDFVFGTPILPLRGHSFDAASGDRFALVNVEARFPLVAALLPGPLPVLPLYNLQGVAFADAAAIPAGGYSAWTTNEEGQRVFDDLYAGAGVGLRTLLLGFPVRADWAWPFDGREFGNARFYLSVGLDF